MQQPQQTGAAERAKRRMNLVDGGTLSAIARAAAERALAPSRGRLGTRETLTLRAAFERELLAGIRAASRRVKGVTRREFVAELERQRDRVLAEARRAERECHEVKRDLARIRRDRSELVQRVDAELERREAELTETIRAMFAQDHDDPTRLEGRMIGLAVEALRETHNRLFDDQDQRVDLLERRVAKLNRSLAAAEHLIRRLQESRHDDAGLASVYRNIQGLSLDSTHFESKRAMLEDIFKSNLLLRSGMRRAS